MRFWVVGNGPSLKDTPLDRIAGEPSVGLNRIHLHYEHTKWRPTHYVKTDHNHRLIDVYNQENLFHTRQGYHCYLWEMFKHGYPKEHSNHALCPSGIGDQPNVTWIPRCKHHAYHHDNYIHKATTWHLPEICTAFSGISPAIQIAVLEGASEIFLIGCDVGYGNPVGKDHFSEQYSLNQKPLGEWDNNEVIEAHELAARSSPVPIYNATIGGKLEVHERVDFLDVVGN